MQLKVGTFNLNNLFDRFDFSTEIGELPKKGRKIVVERELGGRDPAAPPTWVRTFQGRLIKAKPLEERKRLAERIREMDADVLCVQEVEDIVALREFNSAALKDGGLDGMYASVALIEGRDPRFIDVGVLSKLPLGAVTSWQHTRHPDDLSKPVFPRDFVEIDILDPGYGRVVLKLFNTHLTSHFVGFGEEDPEGTAKAKDEQRKRQAEMAASIVAKRTSRKRPFVICGDFNDPPNSPWVAPLVHSEELELTDALAHAKETHPFSDDPPPPTTIWTHRFRDSKQHRTDYTLFDQMWIGPALSDHLAEAWIERRERKTKDGSDHDPAFVLLEV